MNDTTTNREAAKARFRAKRDADKAMPARERIYWTLHATMTHAEAEALLAEVERDALAKRVAELEDSEERVCADCGHLESAHKPPAEEPDDGGCDSSGAQVTSCTCEYYIPGGAS